LRFRDDALADDGNAPIRQRTATSTREGVGMDAPPPAPVPDLGRCRFSLAEHDDGVIGVTVDGDLDPVSAQTLVELVETAIDRQPRGQVEIDLRRLRACSNSGVRALASCAELGARVREGLRFRMGITSETADTA
jgi:hypothetical protein